MRNQTCLALLLAAAAVSQGTDPRQSRRSWASDNGNGNYSNPLFYAEFSDPDMIRVGSDYYLTGTTMHTMPVLPILHFRDLVNWQIIGYAFDRTSARTFDWKAGRASMAGASGPRVSATTTGPGTSSPT